MVFRVRSWWVLPVGDRNAQVHPLLREAGGWYGEDAAWACRNHLAGSLPGERQPKRPYAQLPGCREASGPGLRPGESSTRDGEAFARDHASDWVVTSAIYSDQHRGFTEVIATRGGRRDPKSDECRFLVPSRDYKAGAFGFVIDEARHAAYDGPSSLDGRRGRAGG